MSMERSGVVTMKGKPVTLVGPDLAVGDKAPEFEAIDTSLEKVTLASSSGHTRLYSVVPSLDTGVCSLQTKKFNEELASLPASVKVFTVSADLPFAQKRFCTAENVKIPSISDHRELSFGRNYGVLIKELKFLARAIFVVDAKDRIAYKEIVPEIATEPNYAKALEAAKKAAG